MVVVGGGGGWWINPLYPLSQGLVLMFNVDFDPDPELDNFLIPFKKTFTRTKNILLKLLEDFDFFDQYARTSKGIFEGYI